MKLLIILWINTIVVYDTTCLLRGGRVWVAASSCWIEGSLFVSRTSPCACQWSPAPASWCRSPSHTWSTTSSQNCCLSLVVLKLCRVSTSPKFGYSSWFYRFVAKVWWSFTLILVCHAPIIMNLELTFRRLAVVKNSPIIWIHLISIVHLNLTSTINSRLHCEFMITVI